MAFFLLPNNLTDFLHRWRTIQFASHTLPILSLACKTHRINGSNTKTIISMTTIRRIQELLEQCHGTLVWAQHQMIPFCRCVEILFSLLLVQDLGFQTLPLQFLDRKLPIPSTQIPIHNQTNQLRVCIGFSIEKNQRNKVVLIHIHVAMGCLS